MSEEVIYKTLDFLGYPEYRVGTDGSIWVYRFKDATRIQRWKLLSGWELKGGYKVIRLSQRGKAKFYSVIHRLVLQAFVGPCPEGMEACHINGISNDNRLENLKWATPKDNCRDRAKHGRWFKALPRGESHTSYKLSPETVQLIRNDFANGFSKKKIAEKYHLNRTTVRQIISYQIHKE